tara:strand:+ start:140 stop:661 length:522 start_codon:yes stop_codon:yes gene_type:complete
MFCCCKKKKENKIHPLEDIFEPRPKSILKNNQKSILKNNNKRVKRKSIYPKENKRTHNENRDLIDERSRKRKEFTEKFCAEIIKCEGCQEHFNLGQHELKINCASCNNFFHCHIAGACVGTDCSVVLDGKLESLKYCMSCVNPYLKINIMENGQCLCKSCEKDPDTPDHYKEV